MEPNESETRPSLLRRFMRGFGSGAINGALIMGIFTAVTYGFGALGILGVAGHFSLGMLLVTTLATGIFGGIMAARRGGEESGPEAGSARQRDASIAPVIVPTIGTAMAQSQEAGADLGDDTPAPGQPSWVNRAGRSNTAGNNIQRIIANQEMSDKSRAAAILAQREAAAGKEASMA